LSENILNVKLTGVGKGNPNHNRNGLLCQPNSCVFNFNNFSWIDLRLSALPSYSK